MDQGFGLTTRPAAPAQLHHRADFGKARVVRRSNQRPGQAVVVEMGGLAAGVARSEEHTSELQSR